MSVEKNFRSTSQSFKELELAHEFETFKQMPKFKHASYAVIHPSPGKARVASPPPQPDFQIRASNVKLNVRRYQTKHIPEHLMRAPQNLSSYSSPTKRPQSSTSSPQKSKKKVVRKSTKQYGNKEQPDKNRLRKAEINQNLLFGEVKKLLEKSDEEFILPDQKAKVATAKFEAQSKRIFRYLYEQYEGRLMPQVQVLKSDFVSFIKLLFKEVDSELADLFLFFCKKLPGSSPKSNTQNGSTQSSTVKNKVGSQSNVRMKDPKKKHSYQKQESELKDIKLDFAIIDNLYDKWLKGEENLSGVLNMKAIKQKNEDFRLKIDSWQKFAEQRKHLQRRFAQHDKRIRESFDKCNNDFTIEKDKVIECILSYEKLCQERETCVKEENIINNFLSELPENISVLEIKDIERLLEVQTKNNKGKISLFNEFITVVKTQCVLNHHYFSFYDIPDLIIKRKYVRKDYELLIKLLNKAKRIYLLEKAKLLPSKPISEIEITDEDLVPLELFDQALAQIQKKIENNLSYFVQLIQDAKLETSKKIGMLKIDSEKTKKIVESYVFINFLNARMEQTHATVFAYNFRNQHLYYCFCAGQTIFKTAREVEATYLDCMKADKAGSSHFYDFKERLTKAMNKFNGKSQGEAESVSETTITNQEKRVTMLQKANQKQPETAKGKPQKSKKLDTQIQITDEDVDEAIATLNPGYRERSGSIDSINFRDSAFDPNLKSAIKPTYQELNQDSLKKLGQGLGQIPRTGGEQYMDDEEEEIQRTKEEEEKKKRENESPYKDLYRDSQGNIYDPTKQYGNIQSNSLIYERVTSSYPLNLPTDYYQKYIQSTIPGKDNGKWFIRPHHLETLTEHPLSVKDDVLNTRYYSHYNQQYGKKEEVNEKTEAINIIENHLEKLKQQNYMLMAREGIGMQALDKMDHLRETMKMQAQEEFYKLIQEKSRTDAKEFIIEAYEAVLLEKRKLEKEVLNKQRQKEYERNRPPQDRWYELKNTEFAKELYRNRMALKPNDENRVYLKTLQDPYLY